MGTIENPTGPYIPENEEERKPGERHVHGADGQKDGNNQVGRTNRILGTKDSRENMKNDKEEESPQE